jgi:hypothetical protein
MALWGSGVRISSAPPVLKKQTPRRAKNAAVFVFSGIRFSDSSPPGTIRFNGRLGRISPWNWHQVPQWLHSWSRVQKPSVPESKDRKESLTPGGTTRCPEPVRQPRLGAHSRPRLAGWPGSDSREIQSGAARSNHPDPEFWRRSRPTQARTRDQHSGAPPPKDCPEAREDPSRPW